MSRSAILYDTQLTITAIDPDGKKFDRVSRIVASSPTDSTRILLDVAVDIYPLTVGQSLNFKLADSLAPDGQEEDAREAWRREGPSLADEAAYVMYGKVYKYDETTSRVVTAYASFGGLLLALTADADALAKVAVGSGVYLLLK
ncbi:RNA polymerase [Tilletiopsis washingtonensis]|uniref:DNA-directed RNA polymerases I, II, and III subunit RPABC3 n=1 Tax=Tilletiopsis washingtonensis TaxID=58919 RepID=A0A316Z7D8_9BASI|nr:RNA polymerase [Tilletiopsis washingtonensis]PWN97680.1 RNA polymerase [Tilletiopsis washingtonensis]